MISSVVPLVCASNGSWNLLYCSWLTPSSCVVHFDSPRTRDNVYQLFGQVEVYETDDILSDLIVYQNLETPWIPISKSNVRVHEE